MNWAKQITWLSALMVLGCKDNPPQQNPLPVSADSSVAISSPLLVQGQTTPLPSKNSWDTLQGKLIVGTSSWVLPKGWVVRPGSGPMRLLELTTPQGVDVVAFSFGGAGGDPAANFERWKGQFVRLDSVRLQEWKGSTGVIRLLHLEGDFKNSMGPMGRNAQAQVQTSQGLLGAIVETPEGNLFFKATSPKDAVRKLEPALRAFLNSAQLVTQ